MLNVPFFVGLQGEYLQCAVCIYKLHHKSGIWLGAVCQLPTTYWKPCKQFVWVLQNADQHCAINIFHLCFTTESVLFSFRIVFNFQFQFSTVCFFNFTFNLVSVLQLMLALPVVAILVSHECNQLLTDTRMTLTDCNLNVSLRMTVTHNYSGAILPRQVTPFLY